MSSEKPAQIGDEVSWKWTSNSHPSGTLAEVKTAGEIAIQSKKGNTIKKKASPDNPAVHLSRSGNDVVKRASELDQPLAEEAKKGQKGGDSEKDAHKKDSDAKDSHRKESHKKDSHKKEDKNGHAGEKHSREDSKADGAKAKNAAHDDATADDDTEEEEHTEKKHKAANGKAAPATKGGADKTDGEVEKKDGAPATKGRGRPKKTDAQKKAAANQGGKKAAKPRTEPTGEGIGSRTRSRAKA